jgi:GT2 family glycosyltransferase
MPRVAVVVPNWNGAAYLEACLASLTTQTCPAALILVDNGSTDASRELVRRLHPEVRIVALPGNLGFAAAANRGIEAALQAGAEFVALFNNDAVAEPDWLAHLLEAALEEPGLGTVTGKLLRMDGRRIDSTGDQLSSWGWAYPRGRDESDAGQFDGPEQASVFCGTGGASLYRGAMLTQTGGFDESFFAYLEDQDLGFRAQLAGWRARYVPRAVARHHMMGTSSRLPGFDRRQMLRNSVLLWVKDMPAPLWWRYAPKLLCGLTLMALNDLRRGRPRIPLEALLGSIRLLPEMLDKRREVQRARTVPVAYIDSLLIHPLPPIQRRLLRGQLRWIKKILRGYSGAMLRRTESPPC